MQQPPPGTGNPLSAHLAGKALDKALLAFPWSRLQVLDAPTCSTAVWAECQATPTATIDVDTSAPRAGEPVSLDTSRSVLNQPRTRVEWDFDGDGTFEAERGSATAATFTPASGGPRTIRVRITTRDGATTTATRMLTIDPAATPSPTPEPTPAPTPEPQPTPPPITPTSTTPVTLRPDQVTPKYFYSYSSSYTALSSLTATTASPALPASSRKLYSAHSSGTATIGFQDLASPAADTTTVHAYVECAATRCLRLAVLDATGTVLGQTDPPYASKGWATVTVNTRLSHDQLRGLQLRATVRNGTPASGNTSLAAVHATVPIASHLPGE